MLRSVLLVFCVGLIMFLLGSVYYFQFQQDASFVTASFNNSFPSYTNTSLQFYPNMRFPSNNISYMIHDCSVQKASEMRDAFSFLENVTNLHFYSVENHQEITVTCSSEVREYEQGFFVAGEGGPINITTTDRYYVISSGKVLLLRESNCPQATVGLHELLHVLGFGHSSEPKSIMYPVSSCSQVLTKDIIDALNELYVTPTLPDLVFKNISANVSNGYLNVRFTVTNQGLTSSQRTNITLKSEDWDIDSVELDSLVVGYGRIIKLTNIRLFPHTLNNLTFTIESSFEEIDKDNNGVALILSH